MKKVKGRNGGTLTAMEKGETLNPNGRPKKSFALINSQLKKEGYEVLKKAELIEAYGIIFNADEERLKKLAKDKAMPYAFKLLIVSLNDKKTRERALADYRDYMFGKATQSIKTKVYGFESLNPLKDRLGKLKK